MPDKPSRKDALEALRTIIRWIGDDPNREGLIDTPKRVLNSIAENFSGYKQQSTDFSSCHFEEIDNYNDLIVLRNLDIRSHCEHHIAPIIGSAIVGYIPQKKVIGISKIARIIEIYSKRLQIQERLTQQIGQALYKNLDALGLAVLIEAKHHCMTERGVKHRNTKMMTKAFFGCLANNPKMQKNFYTKISSSSLFNHL